MELTAIQVVGYVASLIIAISMTMNSIVKFRWINLIGAITFSIYGFVLEAYPVGVLNAFIVSVDLYYLYKIYSKKEVFETLEVRAENRYLIRFLQFHDVQIQKYFPGFSYIPEMNTVSFFILRDMSVAGIFLAHRINNDTLKVGLDYVIPEYRDFKNGRYVYLRLNKKFVEAGYTKILASGNSKEYINYLKKLGFKENSEGLYEMSLV
jgi:hypothetical protein